MLKYFFLMIHTLSREDCEWRICLRSGAKKWTKDSKSWGRWDKFAPPEGWDLPVITIVLIRSKKIPCKKIFYLDETAREAFGRCQCSIRLRQGNVTMHPTYSTWLLFDVILREPTYNRNHANICLNVQSILSYWLLEKSMPRILVQTPANPSYLYIRILVPFYFVLSPYFPWIITDFSHR